MDLRKHLVKKMTHVSISSEESYSESEKHEGESSLAIDITLPPAKRKRPCSDATLVQLMRITIEGPDQTEVSFDEILDVFKESNHRIQL